MQGLEPLFQLLRINKVWSHIQWGGTLVDFGCDVELTLLRKVKDRMNSVIGIDIINPGEQQGNMTVIRADLEKKLPIPSATANTITMLAVLEHLKHPDRAIKEAYRILKPGGVFLVTVPSQNSANVLPLLARVGIVRQEMIDQHENYFSHSALSSKARAAGFSSVSVETWELGFNTFMKAVK